LAAVYGRTVPRFAEHAPLRPLSVYANTMAFGEVQTALQLGAVGTSHAVVRYFSVYGEPQVMKSGSHSWVVAWFAARAALGLPLQLNGGGHQVRDLVHVDDIADGTLHALASPAAGGETADIGTGCPTTIRRGSPASSQLTTPERSCWRCRCRPATRSATARAPRTCNRLHATPAALPAWLRAQTAAKPR
jgi:UDP-glucose 4-epimerase/dTDP-L-rhamnose 4-epimerase